MCTSVDLANFEVLPALDASCGARPCGCRPNLGSSLNGTGIYTEGLVITVAKSVEICRIGC
jgi:hypothetical protein